MKISKSFLEIIDVDPAVMVALVRIAFDQMNLETITISKAEMNQHMDVDTSRIMDIEFDDEAETFKFIAKPWAESK